MKVAVLTPVGPGHDWSWPRALASSQTAWRTHRGPFTEFEHFLLDDRKGWHGRAYGRNILQERAIKGWNADWVIHLDSNDMIHPFAFRNIGVGMEQRPEARSIWGCHSLLLERKVAVVSYDPGTFSDWDGSGESVHVYRTRFDISPIGWVHLMRHSHWGTLGTIGCIEARLAYKIGFLPEIPAGEFFEFSLACCASAPFWKLRHPIVITDRVTTGSDDGKFDNPDVDQNPILDRALGAIHEIWVERGRVPFTQSELADRHASRFKRRQDFEQMIPVEETEDTDWLRSRTPMIVP